MTKAIILCAGMGKRLEGYLGGIPKSLIQIGEKTIIERQIETLRNLNINEIAIVMGYNKALLEKKLNKFVKPFWGDIDYYFNPFYETTNSITSFWLARDFLTEDTLIINGDILFKSEIIKRILKIEADCCLAVDIGKYNELGYKVQILNDEIKSMGMNISKENTAGEYAGISYVSERVAFYFVELLDIFMAKKMFNEWYENTYLNIINSGIFKVSYANTNPHKWIEIDTPEDIKKAEEVFK